MNRLFTETEHAKDVEVHSSVIRPALPKKQLDELFNEYKLPSALMTFYEQMNGCQLSYTFKTNMDFKKDEFGYYDREFPFMWPNENYWHLDGCINILPVDFVYRNNWKDYIWFDTKNEEVIWYKGQEMKQSDFDKKIKPVDLFSKDSIAVLFPGNDLGDILLSTDHNASYTEYEPISFNEYLDGIIKTKGIIDKRSEIFTSKKHNKL